MNAQVRPDRISILSLMGLGIAFIGLLWVLYQGPAIDNEAYYSEQTNLLVTLCWLVFGVAVILFGIGLIIAGQKKWI